MRAKILSFFSLSAILVFAVLSCKGPQQEESKFTPTKQQKAEDAIKGWMFENNEYPHYKPIVFGDINARYEKSDRTLQIMTMIDEAEAEGKESGNTERVDSLRKILDKNLGNLLGYILLHKFQSINLAGEIVTIEYLFFLDSTFRVASVLSPESFDMIMTEKVFYQLDPEN